MVLTAPLLLALVEKIFVVVVIAYLITRTRYFSEVIDHRFTLENTAVLILIFGSFSVFGTLSGVEMFGIIANVRDLGPMIGGLTGGPLIGLGAGLIGGVHRYLQGGFTALPCSLATALAGLLGGLVYLLNRRRFVGTLGSVAFATIMEGLHTVMTLMITDPNPRETMIIQEAGISMIISNSLGMLIFAFMISNLMRERETAEERDRYLDELERKKYELMIAREIQQSIIPETMPSLKGFELAAISHPAREVGGDFYDFIPVSEHELGLTIGDVSGKSVSAALFMVLSRTIVRTSAAGKREAADAIFRANNLIASDARSGMFVTLFYAILDQEARTFTYVNAGHNPPLLLNKESGEISFLRSKGIALGVLEDPKLEEKRIVLKEGDVVIFYTDGVIEAMNKREEMFGMERLAETSRINRHKSAPELVEIIKEEVLSFSEDMPQFDDVTLMVLKVK